MNSKASELNYALVGKSVAMRALDRQIRTTGLVTFDNFGALSNDWFLPTRKERPLLWTTSIERCPHLL
jgi:hypothetical protein